MERAQELSMKKRSESWVGIAASCGLVCVVLGYLHGHSLQAHPKRSDRQPARMQPKKTKVDVPAYTEEHLAVGDFGPP
jgi:hypothetical protein